MGDVHYSFVVVGAVMTCAGAICLPLRRVSAWERGALAPRPATVDGRTGTRLDSGTDRSGASAQLPVLTDTWQ